jgi:methylated-DNA-[protein]-cysteine S-methyltransferase
MYYCYHDSPIGELLLAGDDEALEIVSFPKGSMRREPEHHWIYSEKPFAAARRQLDEYFSGERTEFDLPLRLTGTEFQLAVLAELRKIPYGATASYRDVA